MTPQQLDRMAEALRVPESDTLSARGATITSSGPHGYYRFGPAPQISAVTFDETVSPVPDNEEQSLESVLKVRHLSRYERQALHAPPSDWKATERGDVCKNACTLEVEDLLEKHKQTL